ncbi:hypothetical protein EON83_25580 [bacterium]|nr:MAG: hypothetical protein EON83_25580 [bacterium]
MTPEQHFFRVPLPDSESLRETFLSEFQADFHARWEEIQEIIAMHEAEIRKLCSVSISHFRSPAFSEQRELLGLRNWELNVAKQWIGENEGLVPHVLNVDFAQIDANQPHVFAAIEGFVARRKSVLGNYYDMISEWGRARDTSSTLVKEEASSMNSGPEKLEVSLNPEIELANCDNNQVKPVELTVLERRVLNVLAQLPDGYAKHYITLLAGYDATGFELQPTLERLEELGYINEHFGLYSATELGRTANGNPIPLLEGKALRNCWRRHLNKCEASILDVLAKNRRRFLSRRQVAELAGYSHRTGSFGAALGKLRDLGLITELCLNRHLENL